LRAVAVAFAFTLGTITLRAALWRGTVKLTVTTLRAWATLAHLRALAFAIARPTLGTEPIALTILRAEAIATFEGRALSVTRSHLWRTLAIALAALRSKPIPAHIGTLGEITIPRTLAETLITIAWTTRLIHAIAIAGDAWLPGSPIAHLRTLAFTISRTTLGTEPIAAFDGRALTVTRSHLLWTLAIALAALGGEAIPAHIRALGEITIPGALAKPLIAVLRAATHIGAVRGAFARGLRAEIGFPAGLFLCRLFGISWLGEGRPPGQKGSGEPKNHCIPLHNIPFFAPRSGHLTAGS